MDMTEETAHSLRLAAGDDLFAPLFHVPTSAGASGLLQPAAGDLDFDSPAVTPLVVDDDYVPDTSNSSAPTYDDIFPALPEAESRPSSTRPPRAPAVRSSNITFVHRVATEDMRHLPDLKPEAEQARICKDIMQRTGTLIELSASRDGSLTFLITGKEEAVAQARRYIGADLQAQSQAEIRVKKEHHRFLLGKNGKKLNDLQAATGTRITVPRQMDESEVVKIVGPKDGIEKVIHEIQVLCTEIASRASEKLTIEVRLLIRFCDTESALFLNLLLPAERVPSICIWSFRRDCKEDNDRNGCKDQHPTTRRQQERGPHQRRDRGSGSGKRGDHATRG